MVGVLDVVVGLVDLADAGERVAGRAVVGAEAPDVHPPQVQRRLAAGDPLGHRLADAARPGQPVRAEAGGHEQPADLRLAEAELAVGRERLGPVDQPRHAHVLHRRHAQARVVDDLLEAVPVLLEQPAVEVRRDRVEPAAAVRERPRRAVALVAAHHQPAALLAEVDEVVGVAQRRQVAARALAERLRDEVLVRHRHDRHAHAGEPGDLRGVHPAGVDEHLALDVAAVGRDAAHGAAADVDPGHAGVREDPAAAAARAVGQRVGEPARVQVAVGRQPGGADHPVGGHQREALLRLLGGDQLQRQPERLRPARPGAASPPSARACTRAGCRRTRSSPGRARRRRAAGRARPSPSSSASARPSRAAARPGPRSGTSSRS